MTFTDRLVTAIDKKNSVLCVGLDPQVQYMPDFPGKYNGDINEATKAILAFNLAIIDAIEPHAAAVKSNAAFYEGYGSKGVEVFEETVWHANNKGLIVIEDAKRGDGGDSAEAYALGHIGSHQFAPIDAMTIDGYIGDACIKQYVDVVKRDDKNGIFVVTKTSFKPSSFIEDSVTKSGLKVWEELARRVYVLGIGTEGKYNFSNVGVVMGATYPEDADRMRELVPNGFFLAPGYGTQGGGADGAVRGIRSDGLGVIVNSSRGIIFAYRTAVGDAVDFAKAAGLAAKKARDDLNSAIRRRLRNFLE